MKVILLILAGVGLLFALAIGYDMYAGPQFVPAPEHEESAVYDLSLGSVPDFSFKTIDGKKSSIHDLRGKPVIINFWATWCPTCLTELPDMLNLIESYEGKVILLAISSDYKSEDITKFIAKQSDNMQKVLKSNAIYVTLDENRTITHDIFLTERYPETIIVSSNGEMVRKIVGEFDWKGGEIQKYLNGLVKKTK